MKDQHFYIKGKGFFFKVLLLSSQRIVLEPLDRNTLNQKLCSAIGNTQASLALQHVHQYKETDRYTALLHFFDSSGWNITQQLE